MFRRSCLLLARLRRPCKREDREDDIGEREDREDDIEGTGEVIATPEYNSWYGVDREFRRIREEAERRER